MFRLKRTIWRLLIINLKQCEVMLFKALCKGHPLGMPFKTKTLLIMQFLAIFLFVVSLQVSAIGFSQKVTLSFKDVPLKTVFIEINKQTGYNFLYADEILESVPRVSVSVKDASIEEVLKVCFQNKKLNYKIENKSIIVKEETSIKHLQFLEIPPVTGVVRGPDGEPIAGVNVVVKGTKKGVVTDAYGRFSIDAEQGKTLVVSNIGYTAKEIKIGGENSIVVGLEISTSKLDEVQIVAYGTNSQRFQTGNVVSVKAKDIEKQPVNNPLLALQGRAPGLFITQSNGLTGGGIRVTIQGQNSIRNGTTPLYVVDGVPYPSELPQK